MPEFSLPLWPGPDTPLNLTSALRAATEHMPCFDGMSHDRSGGMSFNGGKLTLQGDISLAPAGVSAGALLHELLLFSRNARASAGVGAWPSAATATEGQAAWTAPPFDAAAAVEERALFDINAPAPEANEPGRWGGAVPSGGGARRRLYPHVARILASEGSTVLLFGDLHGSLHSLLRILAGLRERGMLAEDLSIAPAWRGGRLVLVFLGDFVDRGAYGAEVVTLLLRLHRANAGPGASGGASDGGGGPGSVWLVRGNHEDVGMNQHGAFRDEVVRKFGRAAPEGADAGRSGVDAAAVAPDAGGDAGLVVLGAMGRWYEALPVAVFLGVHGAERGAAAGPEDGTPAMAGACSAEELSSGGCGLMAHSRGGFVLGCHGGIEAGFNARPLLAHPSLPSHGDAGGVRSLRWPLTALMRGRWLDRRAGWAAPHVRAAAPRGSFADLASAEAGPGETWGDGDGNGDGASPAAPRGLYPAPPAWSNPGLGFLWTDFYVDDDRPVMGWTPGRGPVFGKRLTRHWLEDSGVAAVVRAHQHHDSHISGRCLSHMVQNGGWAGHWGGDGSVTTFLSGAGIPNTGLGHEGVGVLRLAGRVPARWSLHHCSRRVGEQLASVTDGSTTGGGGGTAEAMRDAGMHPAVTHSCDPGFRLRCSPLPWAGQPPQAVPEGGDGESHPLPGVVAAEQAPGGDAGPRAAAGGVPALPAPGDGDRRFSAADLDVMRDSEGLSRAAALALRDRRIARAARSAGQALALLPAPVEDVGALLQVSERGDVDAAIAVEVAEPVHGSTARALPLSHGGGTASVLRVSARVRVGAPGLLAGPDDVDAREEGAGGAEPGPPAPAIEACLLLMRPQSPGQGGEMWPQARPAEHGPVRSDEAGAGVPQGGLAAAETPERCATCDGEAVQPSGEAGGGDGESEHCGRPASRDTAGAGDEDAEEALVRSRGEAEEAEAGEPGAAGGRVPGWEAVGATQCKRVRWPGDGATVALVRFRSVLERGARAVVVSSARAVNRTEPWMRREALGSPAASDGPLAAVVALRRGDSPHWLAWDSAVFVLRSE